MTLSRKKVTSLRAWFKCFLLALCVALPFSASATPIGTLYQGEVPVASYSQADWQKAITPALWQVLVKVTGNPQVTQVPAMRKAVSKPESLVQSYNYSTLEQAGRSVSTLQVRFSPKAVDALLQKAGQPLLPRDRPLTLVWLVMPDAQGQPHVLTDPKDAIVAGLQLQADALALPVLWPTLDLSNVSATFAAQVGAFDGATVAEASQRYQADNILVGNISKAPNSTGWQVQWQWLAGATAPTWQTQGATTNMAVNAVLPSWLQQVRTSATTAAANTTQNASSAAPDAAGQGQVVKMEVMGVRGLGDYTALLDYLKASSLVASIDTLQMNDTRLVLAVSLTGSRSAFIQSLATTGTPLESQMANFGNGVSESSMLKYRWVAQDVLPAAGSVNTNPAVQSFAAPTSANSDTGLSPQ